MPDPLPCPACDAKIIINGDTAAKELEITCESIERFLDKGGVFPDALKLVMKLNHIEDLVFKFKREVLEQQGFEGPWPHSLTNEGSHHD